jgi:hypothetical protein
MEFDKSLGKGYWNVEDATYLDDVAFSLLCDVIKKRNSDYRNQSFFIYWKDEFPFNKYYEQAKILIRKEKLDKIINQ